jgi:hypothetical protein
LVAGNGPPLRHPFPGPGEPSGFRDGPGAPADAGERGRQLRPDGIKPSILRFDKIFIADHASNDTKKREAQVPLIPFLKCL